MKLHAKIALAIALGGSAIIVGWSIIEPYWTEYTAASFSDSGENGSISIAVDGWVGYFPLCSPEMKKRLNRQGYGLNCVDDSADYEDRFRKLKSSHYDFAVGSVDSYVLNGNRFNYPGVIVSVIDESKGGDAIVANQEKLKSLDDLKAMQDVSIAFTPDSPSHHLIKSVATHFDLDTFKDNNNFLFTEGSDSALNALQDQKADIAVLWEPEVSIALENPKFKKLLGTEDTQQLIVDVLLAGHKTIKNHPDYIEVLLVTYFKTLKHYKDNESSLVKDLSRHYKVNKDTAQKLIKGVEWATLYDNAESWYGLGQSSSTSENLIHTIESSVDILIDADDFNTSPIPDNNPYRLINSDFIDQVFRYFNDQGVASNSSKADPKDIYFSKLNNREWDSLKDIGSLKVRAISFSSGTSELTQEGKKQIDQIVKDLDHYPNFRVEVRGHTGLRGDKKVNLKLSQERADTVLHYIENTHSVTSNRIRAKGFGSSKPLPKKQGESNRAYKYRLPRVELALVREVL